MAVNKEAAVETFIGAYGRTFWVSESKEAAIAAAKASLNKRADAAKCYVKGDDMWLTNPNEEGCQVMWAAYNHYNKPVK